MISVIVIFYNMRREAPRTLFSLSTAYQQGVNVVEWEVIAIDNGSSEPLDEAMVCALGSNFRYHYHPTTSASPVEAIHAGVRLAQGDWVSVCIDGARMASPGILAYTQKALAAFENPFVCTLGWHLGHEVQNLSIPKGYGPAEEDRLLASVDWRNNGYALFEISSLALSAKQGWFSPIAESNFFTLSRTLFDVLGGFDEGFQTPGGGLANLDFFNRVCEHPGTDLVILLGEGTFHQVHGGVATNVAMADHPWESFHEEYLSLRKQPYATPSQSPHYLGHLPPAARRFLLSPNTATKP